MLHKERFFTALDLREPDFVPITDLGLDPPIVEAITGKKAWRLQPHKGFRERPMEHLIT